MKNDDEEEILGMIYELLLKKRYYTRKYLKFLMWKKIIYFHYPHLIRTDYYLRKIFNIMIERDLFIPKKDRNRIVYKLNDFRLYDEIDVGYISF